MLSRRRNDAVFIILFPSPPRTGWRGVDLTEVERLNQFRRNLGEEHARHGVPALATEFAIIGVAQVKLVLRPRHADETEPAFFFNILAFWEAALVRQQTLLHRE